MTLSLSFYFVGSFILFTKTGQRKERMIHTCVKIMTI